MTRLYAFLFALLLVPADGWGQTLGPQPPIANQATSGDVLVVCANGQQICDPFGQANKTGDVAPTGLVIALGLHRLISTYTGPLVQVVRASDSATMNLTQDALGNLNQAMCAAFQGSSTLLVKTWYDQTINGNNAVEATTANQPTLNCSVPQLNGLPGILFGPGCSAFELVINSSASWQGFMSGASAGAVMRTQFQSSLPSGCNGRYWELGSAANFLGEQTINGLSTLRFLSGASTSNGDFRTTQTVGTTAAHVVDVQYQWTNTTNVPTYTIDGTAATLGTSTAPVGTVGTDSGQNLIVGNNTGSPISGWPGYFTTFMMWKAGPGAAQIEAARKAEGTYYGITVN